MFRFLGRFISAGFSIIVIGIAVALAISNPDLVSIRLWPFSSMLNLPIWLLVVICFGAGLILGGLAMLVPLTRSKMTERRLKKSIAKLEQEKPQDSPKDDAKNNLALADQSLNKSKK